ncbi:MAG: AAA family ATPase [Clostridia bacterium]|nr:AAA family ATPase [Clostridia bacterium]
MIGEIVRVIVDRPLGSCHPRYADLRYPVNYGYVAGVMAPDGEEQDAYILGVEEPVSSFVGKCIAVIHRYDDVEEKWVVVPEGVSYTKEEILRQVAFQEQYFDAEVRMEDRILLCGLNGVGKSTLGRALAEALGRPFLDIEDYWFPERQAGEAYETHRTPEEVFRALQADLIRYPDCILASVKGNMGEENLRLFSAAVWLHAPDAVRMERIKARSLAKFGERMLPGGDLFEKENQFFAMAAARTEAEVEDRIRSMGIPVFHADGTLPVPENTEILVRLLHQKRIFSE